jgi:hypothetical protein
MPKFRWHPRLCMSTCAVVVIGLVTSQAQAGSLTFVVTASDGMTLAFSAGPIATSSNGGNTLTVTNLVAVNTFLSTNGSAVQFGGLQASSNFAPSSGNAAGSFVTQTGSIYYDNSLAGNGLASVQVFQNGFMLPTGLSGLMQSASTANFTSATAGSSETFTSTYNGTLNAPGQTSTSTGVAQNNYSPSSNTPIPSYVTPFEISNLTSFSLLPNPNAQSTDGFTGSTTITAAVIPEPASLVLLGMGMPLAFVFALLLRRRRAAATA